MSYKKKQKIKLRKMEDKKLTIHYFGCEITDFHKNWDVFTVECGRTVIREQVSFNKKEVTCKSCLKLIEKAELINMKWN